MRKILVALAVTLATFSTSLALTLPGPKERKAGNLSVLIVASDSMQYIKDSVVLAQHASIVINKLHKVKPGDLTYFAFLVSGLTPGKKEMNYSVGYTLLDPTGKVIFTEPRYANGKISKENKQMLLLSDPILEVVMENSDLPGKYRLEAKVTDQVTKKTATGFYEITLVK